MQKCPWPVEARLWPWALLLLPTGGTRGNCCSTFTDLLEFLSALLFILAVLILCCFYSEEVKF